MLEHYEYYKPFHIKRRIIILRALGSIAHDFFLMSYAYKT